MDSEGLKLILASASPRRRELLARMGLQFVVQVAAVEEDDSGSEGPEQMVLKNAALKADALTAHYPESLVLGSDTTVALGDQVLSKPADLEEARAMLRNLSGKTHTVYTAVALRCEDRSFSVTFVETSLVKFKALDAATIDAYFTIVNPLDKAGAYGIQAGRELIIESVDGSVENVMGLPIQALAAKFSEHGFDFKH
jgi:septum formation protein